jgi:hypothetical protein
MKESKKKTGNEISPNVNLVSNICQLIVYLTVGTYQIIFENVIELFNYKLTYRQIILTYF